MNTCHGCNRNYEIWRSTFEQPYHYKESGLSHVYLVGVTVYSCPNCEVQSADIPDMDGLHNLVAKDLILTPIAMAGEELRFLRKETKMTPKVFAELVEVDPKTISNWESSAELSKQTDVALRFLIASELFHGNELDEVLASLSELAKYSWDGESEQSTDDDVAHLMEWLL
jgi:DNA-binding transcriptional regulator YiaG